MAAWPSSLRSRLTLWYTVLLGLPLIALAIGGYLVFARTLQRRTDQFIADALTAFARELVAERRAALSLAEAMRSTVEEVHFRELRIAILDSANRVLLVTAAPGGTGAPVPDDERLAAALARQPLRPAGPLALTVAGPRGGFRLVAQPLVVDGQRFGLAGTYSLGDDAATLQRIRRLVLVVIPLLIGCAASGGYLLAKRSLAPVSSMAARAAEISASNLGDRLPVGGGQELVGLARVVNDLLDRLEHAFDQQRRFVADASHELRTPAAILRSEADVTLAQEHRDEAEYRASLRVIQDGARRVGRIVDDLFLLARADAGEPVGKREPLYLEDVVHDAVRAMQSVAERRGVRLELVGLLEAPFEGDADLLGRLLLNLLDNAIKYSPAGGSVRVSMARRNGGCEIAVSDQGPGISEDARERVFERFYRGDAARSGGGGGGGAGGHRSGGGGGSSGAPGASRSNGASSGAGLGLAIARRIAELHAGRLELAESRPGFTEFRVWLGIRN